MLTEENVVDAVCRDLEGRGYTIITRATVTQHGHDIVASKDGANLIIEAKGAGSSKMGTARYGSAFTSNQVFDHVAKAVLKAMRVVAGGEDRGGVALPDDASHRREVDQVIHALHAAGIAVFWVAEDGKVRVDSPWPL
jgi:Holliday junction resolvase-like predicted endonuclease